MICGRTKRLEHTTITGKMMIQVKYSAGKALLIFDAKLERTKVHYCGITNTSCVQRVLVL